MRFDCGCDFKELDFEKINLECPATWDLISQGLTKGLFQIEGSLGKRFCKKIQPRNMNELAAVISLIRPGCLEAEYREDPKTGKMLSITRTYVKTKAGELKPEYIDPVLEPIFRDTFGVPVYQEQIMRICTDFAGFTLQEADTTRKAVGKKLVDVMAEVEKKFIKGSIRMGHSEEMAKTVFSWIDKFSGYGFNRSHAVSYAFLGYWGAYAKVHFPIEFFKNKLAFSDSNPDEFDEIKQLVHEARLFGINVLPPSIELMNSQFEFTATDDLVFGLSHIKGIGKKALPPLKTLNGITEDSKLFERVFGCICRAAELERKCTCRIKKNVLESLIKCGVLDVPMNRVQLLGRYKFMQSLTDRERNALLKNDYVEGKSVAEMVDYLIASKIPRPGRIEKIENMWKDTTRDLGGHRKKMVLAWEKFHMGMPLSGSEVELYNNYKVNTTCKDFLVIKDKSRVKMGVIIEEVREIHDKNNNPMCFMKISDNTYMLDSVVVFTGQYTKFGWIIEEGKAVLISGKKRDGSLLVDSIEHL